MVKTYSTGTSSHGDVGKAGNQETRALQYAVPANCLLLAALSLLIPAGPLSAAMMLDAFLLAMAAIGISGHAAVLIVPNMAIKILLLLIMLFIGCVSIDTFHAHYIKEAVGIVGEPEVLTQSPVSLWRSVVHNYPSLPLWIIAFVLIIIVEIRLFFCAWYRIAFSSYEGDVKDIERRPPSYAYCISHSTPSVCVSADELPSYEEAIRRSSVPKPSNSSTPLPRSSQQPCCSTSSKSAPQTTANATTTTTSSSSSRRTPWLMKSKTFQRHLNPSASTESIQRQVDKIMATMPVPEDVAKLQRSWKLQQDVTIQVDHPQSDIQR
ncbi:unnamed protein product [Haemonchus placei]|uniref:Transmembrane protein n=1 Tax=Haemonchus placei TaxID=6290 RepID=A0A158QPE0_HAEPC|nr:unnamed protein product [Haemonchus placei]